MEQAVAIRRRGIGIFEPASERFARLGAWFSQEHPKLVRFAYTLTREATVAEDLVQEAYVRMHRAGARIDPDRMSAYARRTIVNLACSASRRRVIEQRILAGLDRDEQFEEPDHAAGMDVRSALLRLSMQDRACLALRHYEGRIDREIAEVLGISSAAAKKRVARAQERLRALLSEEEP